MPEKEHGDSFTRKAVAAAAEGAARDFLSSQSTSSFSSQATSENGLMTCGRGDKKTKRGKRFKGSFGNARPKKEKKIQRIKDRIEVPSHNSTYPPLSPKTWRRFLLPSFFPEIGNFKFLSFNCAASNFSVSTEISLKQRDPNQRLFVQGSGPLADPPSWLLPLNL
ncbi:hypothetical protein M5K25_022258 [Dendrobium thyrsiflorum]|uniref:30S ribosomal protein S31, chloroplastic n=1 Tax=Dendrobium thyrsiflorum TaxID=117978 RepID=A0ABD0U5T8_DENTH